jgi:L-aspartate oxidase
LIKKCNVNFDKISKELHLTAEGAHSEPRIIHSKDKTGLTIHQAVEKAVVDHPNIEIRLEHTAVDLLTLSHHSKNTLDIYKKPACFGDHIQNNESGKIFPVFAAQTILASGGVGQIFLHTTNPAESTGDGIALAWRAGARCFNLQYIQFHPTTLYNEQIDRFLISEAVRGEGGVLIDKFGNKFMNEYHELGSLAPRDIVARGIHQTMLDTEHPCVYLDISFKDGDWLRSRFPTIYAHCKANGIDITSEPIPVVPAAHYSCGGVGVSLKGRTSLQRLYAVGEVSCTGVHGANRLASTSLLESVVWGHIAGKDASEKCQDCEYFPEIYAWEDSDQHIDPALISQDWLNIKNTMWNYVGLVRTKRRLDRAKTILRHLQTEVEQFYKQAKMSRATVQLRNGVQTAIAITNAASESRVKRLGAHYMLDED